jgi:hypothetical protein
LKQTKSTAQTNIAKTPWLFAPRKKTTIGILAKSSNDPDKSKIPTLPEKMAACWLAAMLFADGFTIR